MYNYTSCIAQLKQTLAKLTIKGESDKDALPCQL